MLAALLCVAGCSNPQSETPVLLQPGLYEVTVGGSSIVQLESGVRTASICFGPDHALALPKDSLSHIVGEWDGCSDMPGDPKGNAIGGSRTCEAGAGHRRKQSVLVTYSGSHSTDSFDVEGMVSQGDDEGGGIMHLGSGDFSITGRRMGDCGA